MEKKIIFWVLSLTLVAVALAILLPGGRQADPNPKLPWKTQLTADQAVHVFELTLGSSTLADARSVLQIQEKINLFIGKDGKLALEAYFERVFLSGLRADFVLVMQADEPFLRELYDRGNRIRLSNNTTRKVELSSEDQLLVEKLPIHLINYIPHANLNEELVIRRFGEPAEKIVESETGITHWIYPDKGISISLNPDGKELIQYMPLNEIAAFISRIEENNRQYEATQKTTG
ncbi:MAG: hypothetical protein PVI97_18055 [Candidatus Thiodiazotropha sp.]|jgi:hypothetical protein